MPKSLYDDFVKYASGWHSNVFDQYKVTIHVGCLAGGVPYNPKMIEAWINAKCKDKTEEERKKIYDATLADLKHVTDEERAKGKTGFKSNDKGLFIEGRQVKAMLKECANVIKNVIPYQDDPVPCQFTALKSKAAERLFVVEDKIYLGRPTADYDEEKPISVMTAQGQRSSIKCTDICENVDVIFSLRVLRDGVFNEKMLYAILEYAQFNGLGAERSQGKGTFKVMDIILEHGALEARKVVGPKKAA